MKNKWGIYPDNNIPEKNKFIGRIVSRRNRDFYLIADDKEMYTARLTGSILHSVKEAAELPVVGDWVCYEVHDNLAIIKQILPRVSVISRKMAGSTTEEQPMAANINIVAIVFGLDGGRNYNSRALERYLTLAWNSGARPVVILNKADVCSNPEAVKIEAEYIAPGVDVILTSAIQGDGVNLLRSMLSESLTIVFIGPSGVGKSALSNALLGSKSQQTGELRESDKRGKHTTTSSMMFPIPGGGVLIDSPGLKEIQLWGELENVDAVFNEISVLADFCRFNDCTHQGEPGCAVQKALADGNLDPIRYDSFLELKKELIYLEAKKDERARHQLRAKEKKIGKMIKDMKKRKIVY
jgi:ribosome biogenesis GTPase / thiamine phosphate phosphatase